MKDKAVVIFVVYIGEKVINCTRGFVFEDQIGYILEDAKCIVLEVLDEMNREMEPEWPDLADEIKRQLKRFFFKVIKRRPLILPIIIPV